MENMIPTYYANITDEFEGITTISLVDYPAVQSDFVAFDKQDKMPLFKFEDEEQRKIMGVIMRCEYPIYRRSETYGEFYIKYSKETIEKMTRKMLAENTGNYVNLMHDGEAYVDGVTLEQVFIKDSSKGVSPSGFEDISDGSMFGVFHVENDIVWDAIKSDTFRGFSLEGYFSIDKEDKTETKMSLKERLRSLLAEFKQVETDNGVLVAVDEVEVGSEVTDEQGNPIADGEYKSEDKVYVVKDGKVEAINDIQVEEEPKAEEPKQEEPASEEPKEEPKKEEEPKAEEEPKEDPQPVVDEPKDFQPEIDALKAQIDAIQAEIVSIKEMLKKPASTPIEEEFKDVVEAKGKNSKLIEALENLKKNK